ncbi:FIST signal transduction protein [Aliikangiella sp. IMCC44632]
MKVSQFHYNHGEWLPQLPQADRANLLIGFGNRQLISDSDFYQQIHHSFPAAELVGCTTSGEIYCTEVYDDSFTLTALEFENSYVEVLSANINQFMRSFDAGLSMAGTLNKENLKYVMVLCDGQLVNGSELTDGLNHGIDSDDIIVTGGMAGDGNRFKETCVWRGDIVESGQIVLCGFYGDGIRIGHGCAGGWTAFGPDRQITRARGNVLYELDNQPALQLYKSYLGEFSEQLPASALRFPLSLKLAHETESVVRTILNINERDQSMIFAGDMPEGSSARLMRANQSALVDGAVEAATSAQQQLQGAKPQFALLISCVGRRLVLSQRTYEELEAVDEVFEHQCLLSGFYSYGELSPLLSQSLCRLHNQTMTITTFGEVCNG